MEIDPMRPRVVGQRVREPRQERSEETFERIIAAAIALFSETGTTEVPVREICDRADASKSSFYARFPSAGVLVRVAYDRFAARVLEVVDEVEHGWPLVRPGGDDLAAYVERVIGTFARFFETEQRLLRAYRMAERADDELVQRRLSLDREILRRTIRSACNQYPDQLDEASLRAALEEGIGVIAAAARGTFDFADQLSIASQLDRQELVHQLSALVLRYVPPRPRVGEASEHRSPSARAQSVERDLDGDRRFETKP